MLSFRTASSVRPFTAAPKAVMSCRPCRASSAWSAACGWAPGRSPPALLQLPHLMCLRARAGSWDALRPVEQLTGLRALEVTCQGEAGEAGEGGDDSGEFGLHLVDLCGLTSLWVRCSSEHLPESLGQLSALRCLALSWCSGLVELPESLGQLPALTSLVLEGCRGLQRLPE